MQDEVLARMTDAERSAWYVAANSRTKLEELVTSWGLAFRPWYGDNSRETLRDEALQKMRASGAVGIRTDLPTTSSAPRWALTSGFAELFDPALDEVALLKRVEEWRTAHLSRGDQLRIFTLHRRREALDGVSVALPDGTVRQLEAGTASLILQGVVEQWAPARMRDPVVLTISEPGDKVYLADGQMLSHLGIAIQVSDLLPDALLVDIGLSPVEFWVVEAVASDGPVTPERKADLLNWAESQGIAPASVRFLSAFVSRGHPAARKRLRDLAPGTHAWFLDEPDHELAWGLVERDDDVPRAVVLTLVP